MNALEPPPQIQPSSADTGSAPTYDARDLIKDALRACIVLDEQTYFLRITRAGKLILTK